MHGRSTGPELLGDGGGAKTVTLELLNQRRIAGIIFLM